MKKKTESKVAGGKIVYTNDEPGPPPPFSTEKGKLLSRIRGIAIIFVGACLLGTIPLFSRPLHTEGIPSSIISMVRMALSCVFATIVMCGAGRNPFALQKDERRALIRLGIFGSGLTSLFYILSLQYTTIALAIIAVFITVPVVTYIMEKMYLQYRVMHLVCLTFSSIGMAVLLWDKFCNPESKKVSEHLIGIGFGIVTGLCFGTYAPYGKKLHRLNVSVILFWAFGIGFLCHLPMLWWTSDPGPTWTRSTAGNFVGLGLCSSFLPYFLIQIGMKSKHINPMQVSMLFLLEPLISVLIGCLFGETLSAWNSCGVALVLLSIGLYQCNSQ
jgi:drug/metabolite transporter (DMT)-like permease